MSSLSQLKLLIIPESSSSYLDSYEALLKSILPFTIKPLDYSIKIIDKKKVKVFKKGYCGTYLAFVYQISVFNVEDDENTEE